MTRDTAVSILKVRQKEKDLEKTVDEVQRDAILQVNKRDQDRFRNEKTLKDLDQDIEDLKL